MIKAIATILLVYFTGLFAQPVLFPFKHKQEKKELSCCAKKHHKDKQKPCGSSEKDDCCPQGKCNPFFSQCSMCAIVCVHTVASPIVYHAPQEGKEKYFISAQHLSSSYLDEMLRPPQMV